jgi:hypothetical protein
LLQCKQKKREEKTMMEGEKEGERVKRKGKGKNKCLLFGCG